MGPRRASDNHQDQGAVPGRWAQERELREGGSSETLGKKQNAEPAFAVRLTEGGVRGAGQGEGADVDSTWGLGFCVTGS